MFFQQLDTSKPSSSSKYLNSSDGTAGHSNASVPSASTYNPDAWQKGKRA